MFCWGNTVNGELGLGGLEDEHIDLPYSQPSSLAWDVEDIACGHRHTLYLLRNGSVYTSGMNDYGQLGHDKAKMRPERVDALQLHVIKHIACGAYHSLAVNEWGQVFAWGSDEKGQCGFGAESLHNGVKMVKSLATKTVVQIACGAHHSLALTATGELYAWGSNEYGQLGIGTNNFFESKPVYISSLRGLPIAFIACGDNHSFVVSKSGAIYGWGKNAFGQLGIGGTEDRLFPTQLKSLRHLRVTYVSCGREHTAVLTQDGGVFTFGAGMYGQLGHGTNGNELTPKKVLELMGSTVTQVACGRYHTLAYIPSRGRVYSFGLGGSGQLGIKIKTNVNIPQVVRGPWVSPGGVAAMETDHPSVDENGSSSKDIFVRKIFCGGDQSFALVSLYIDSFDPEDYRVLPTDTSILYVHPEKIKAIRMVGVDELADDELMNYAETVFSSITCMCGSFLRADGSHYGCSSKNHGVDVELATEVFSQISRIQNSSFSELILNCISRSLIPELPSSPADVEVMRIFVVLPLYQEFLHAKQYALLQVPFAAAILRLSTPAGKILDQWWASLKSDYLSRLVEIYKRVVVHVMSSLTAADSSDERKLEPLKMCLEVLRKVNYVNRNLAGQKISYEAFYIPEVTGKINVKSDYVNWLADFASVKPRGFHFCSYPFVFDSHAKTLLLQTDQSIQMQTAMNEAASRALSFPRILFSPPVDPQAIQFLVLNVSRDNLVQDTIAQLSAYGTSDLKKPLKVKFKNEEADDAGGVRKEFFMLLIKEILDPNYGMFKVYEETRAIWFSEHSFEMEGTFFLIGLLCGLAIYNYTIINLPFPLVLYKKLLNEEVRLDDLAGLSPTMLRSLHSLLEYDEDDAEEVFCLNFAVTCEVFGQVKSVPLKPGGEDIAVTQKNKQEYVDLYVDYVLNKSIESQFKAFNTGFHKVCGGRVLELFQAHELMELVTGNENYDWYELEKNAEYKNGFSANDPTIRYFWETFHELPLEQKKKFLLFLTGSDRVPILGMKAIKIVIQKVGSGDNFLPVAHTCFNMLDLPQYQTKERLKYKLLQAIQQSQGFALA